MKHCTESVIYFTRLPFGSDLHQTVSFYLLSGYGIRPHFLFCSDDNCDDSISIRIVSYNRLPCVHVSISWKLKCIRILLILLEIVALKIIITSHRPPFILTHPFPIAVRTQTRKLMAAGINVVINLVI